MTSLPIKVHTILFTEDCPLDCRYCYLKTFDTYHKNKSMTEDEILRAIDKIDKENPAEECHSRLLLTGGEPFLYWDTIVKILKKYGNRFSYEFNTSGYLLTTDRIRFLSHYPVNFVLSVDGDKQLTNYLRPLLNKDLKYYDTVKQIIPTLLYYFPDTAFKCIVHPRYVDLLYRTYLTAEKLGFKYFSPILDFKSRGLWTNEKKEILFEQFKLIARDFLLGFEHEIIKPQDKHINIAIKSILNPSNNNSDCLDCKVFNGRTNQTLNNKKISYCMSSVYPNIKEAKEKYDKSNKGYCLNNPNCDAYNFCSIISCPKNSLDTYGEFHHIEELECLLGNIEFKIAKIILNDGLDLYPNNKLFINYLKGVEKSE